MSGVYDFEAENIDGKNVSLTQYQGSVLLIVNVASQCGLTPQYTGLEALQREHRAAGLVVLGFPCNQFGQQEPGSAEAIKDFCATRYDVSFPLFSKIDVNGPKAHPLYCYLRAPETKGSSDENPIAWNFTKFLVGRDGRVKKRFEPQETPEQIAAAVASELAKP